MLKLKNDISIYDRSGKVVEKLASKPWEPRIENLEGVYYWRLCFKNNQGTVVEKTGMVTLQR